MDLLIDVSQYAIVTNWAEIGAHVKGVIMRIAEGNDLDDKYHEYNTGAKAAGIKRGIYHVANPRFTVEQHLSIAQANYDQTSEIKYALDIELAFDLDNATIKNFTKNILDRFEAWLGYKPTIYTARWWWNPHMKPTESWYDDYDYWMAAYPFSPGVQRVTWEQLLAVLPKGWTAPVDGGSNPILWQCSGDKFILPGTNSVVEIDITNEFDKLLVKTAGAVGGEAVVEDVAKEAEKPPIEPYTNINSLNLLNVPYISQIGLGANSHNNDCGAAASAMLIGAYTGDAVTPDEFYDRTGVDGDQFLSIDDMRRVIHMYGVTTEWRANLDLGELYEIMVERKPIIALIKYKSLRDAELTEKKEFTGPHFLVVVGMDVKHVYVNDPFWEGSGGLNLAVPASLFLQCWMEVGMDPAVPNPKGAAIIPQFSIGQAIPGRHKRVQVTTAGGLWLRTGPGTTYQKIKILPQGKILEIEVEQNGWGKIASQVGWISLLYTKTIGG